MDKYSNTTGGYIDKQVEKVKNYHLLRLFSPIIYPMKATGRVRPPPGEGVPHASPSDPF